MLETSVALCVLKTWAIVYSGSVVLYHTLPSHVYHTSITLPSHFHHTYIAHPSHFHHTSITLPSHFHHISITLPSHFHHTSFFIIIAMLWVWPTSSLGKKDFAKWQFWSTTQRPSLIALSMHFSAMGPWPWPNDTVSTCVCACVCVCVCVCVLIVYVLIVYVYSCCLWSSLCMWRACSCRLTKTSHVISTSTQEGVIE